MADIFISYKREDRQIAERLSIALEQLGFVVWWDLNLISGQPYRAAIRAVIDQCKAAIVLWSKKSVQSEFVMDEASYAHRLGKLCPARIDDVELPMGFGQTHTADLVGWNGETTHRGFQNVVSAVETRVGRRGRLGASARTPEAEAGTAELEAFKTAQYASTPQALKAFLRHFPRGLFANFVRGQLESIEGDAPQAAAAQARTATPPPHEPPRVAPSYQPPPPRVTHAYDAESKKAPPWSLFAIGTLSLALVAVAVSLRPWEQRAPEQTAIEAASPARDVDSPVQAAPRAEGDSAFAREEQRLAAAGGALGGHERVDATAANELGYRYQREHNYSEAVRQYRLGVGQGDARSQALLAIMHMNGWGVSADDAEALRLFRLSASQGDAEGQFGVAFLLEAGRGAPRDYEEAARQYRRAVAQGHMGAHVRLGYLYQQGFGVPVNHGEAVRLYQTPADRGHSNAQALLATMYLSGQGLSQSDSEALRLYRLSAAQNDPDGLFGVGYMYENGRGVFPSSEEANRWYGMAARRGHAAAQATLTARGLSW